MVSQRDIIWDGIKHREVRRDDLTNVVPLRRSTAREELAQRLVRELREAERIARADAERRRERRATTRQRRLYPWLVGILLVLILLWLMFVEVPK